MIGLICAALICSTFPHQALCNSLERKDVIPLGLTTYQEACYGDLGCFSTAPPFSAFGRTALLPDSPEKIGTQYVLYTRKNRDAGYNLRPNDAAILRQSNFNPEVPTKIVIHGWNDDHKWLLDMTNQFLIAGDYNVILVKWALNGFKLYAQAAANTRVVGAETAQLIQLLVKETGADVADFHLLGHSMGAHVSGHAGERLPGLGRITGMDPADPYFQNFDRTVRLDETDAELVDIVHTDAGDIFNVITTNGGLGLWQPSGHVDVYPNGGKKQNGCKDKGPINSLISDGLSEAFRHVFGCNHVRGYEYPMEAIAASVCPWRVYRCDGGWDEFKTGRCLRCPDGDNKYCNSLGTRASKPADGSVNNMYWVMTGNEAPFCRYHHHIQLTIRNDKNKEQKGRVWVKLFGENGVQTDFIELNPDNFYIKPGAVYDNLIITKEEMKTVTSIELKWQHDAPFYEISQWQWSPTIIPDNVKIFSGEFQTDAKFCDNGSSLKTKESRRLTACQ